MAYESRLNCFIPGKPWMSIRRHDRRRFSGTTVMDVLRTHPYARSGSTMTEKPSDQDPDIRLSQNSPHFLKND